MAIHFESVAGLTAAFGRVPAEMRVALRPALREAGEVVAAKARSNASWSTRIPGAISVTPSFSSTGGVMVKVDSGAAPHARPYEGRSSGGGIFRHPVFGHIENPWVPQQTRPFLKPARDSEGPKAVALIAEAVKIATADI